MPSENKQEMSLFTFLGSLQILGSKHGRNNEQNSKHSLYQTIQGIRDGQGVSCDQSLKETIDVRTSKSHLWELPGLFLSVVDTGTSAFRRRLQALLEDTSIPVGMMTLTKEVIRHDPRAIAERVLPWIRDLELESAWLWL